MLVPWVWLVHVPRPPLGIIETKLPDEFWIITLSPLSAVPLLMGGESCAICMAFGWPFARLICRRLSMRFSLSRISLSPASSLIPGSRYMHSAPSSVQSLHFGLVPSHLDFRERQTSHYEAHLKSEIHVSLLRAYNLPHQKKKRKPENQKTKTYRYRGSPSGVINRCVRIPPLEWVRSLVARRLLHTIGDLVGSKLGSLREIPRLLRRAQYSFAAETGALGLQGRRGLER